MVRPRTVFVLLALALCGESACWFLWRPLRSRTDRTPLVGLDGQATDDTLHLDRSPDRFAGSQACRNCHEHEYQTYVATNHSRALSLVVPDREPPDGVFDHTPSGRRYRVVRRDGRLMHEESLLSGDREQGHTDSSDGEEMRLSSLPVMYAVGSGHFGKTYLCEADGFLIESPITWYEPRESWGMSPGYDKPQHSSFTRVVPENCLLCHTGHVEPITANHWKVRIIEESIGCERCHGPGRAHVERQSAERKAGADVDDSIINPKQLSRKLSEAICQQCHLQGDLQVAGRGVQPDDYRPGLPLERFRCEFRIRRPAIGMSIVGHFEQLTQSDCYRQSETFTCVTCHDPHVDIPPASRPEHFRSVCLTCHGERGCKVDLEIRQNESQNDCVACHMPKSQTEVPHVAFTHHRIGIHPLPDESGPSSGTDAIIPLSDLSALSEADQMRTLLLVRLQMLRRMGPAAWQSEAGREFARQIDESWQNVASSHGDADLDVSSAEFLRMCGRTAEAVEFAERALEYDEIATNVEFRALALLGTVAFEQRRFYDARHWFEKLATLRRDAMALYHLGLCQQNCGDTAAAIRSLEACCAIDPANIGAYETLASFRQARREFEEETRLRTIIDRLKRHSARSSR